MRGIYHDQVAHKFIEGPIQSKPVESSLQEGTAEKAAYHADLTQGYDLEDDTNGIDVSYHDANERYD